MFIVVPYLSSDQTTYGIYSVCISVTIFLSYADLGFLSAAQKYAAESYVRGDRKREAQLIGFSHFILLVVVLLLSVVFLYFSFHPSALISNILPGEQTRIASSLLMILAIFTPTTVIQRTLQVIFGIRLQEYNLQRLSIIGNIIKIGSVFYFFAGGRYDIVGYFLFAQLISFMVAVVGIWLAKRNYRYDFGLVFRSFKFDKDIFAQTKHLAFSSLFVTIAWILYYELDSVAIGKMLGAQAVAIYAIGLTILGFIRSLLGVFFSPFSARFNHFVGVGLEDEFKRFYQHVMFISFPLVVFPLVAIAIMAKGLVISWVGVEYSESVRVAQWLVMCNVLGFISYPAGVMLMAREKVRQMYVVNGVIPLIFWGGIFTTITYLGVESFALFKFTAFAISGLAYLWFTLHFLQISLFRFARQIILPYLPGLLVMIVLLLLLQNSCIDGKNKLNLLANVAIVVLGVLVAIGISVVTCKPLIDYAKKTVKTITKR